MILMSASTTSAHRLYILAHDRAMKRVGPDVFRFQNDVVKHALVAVEIAAIVDGQDEDADPKKVLALLADMLRANTEMYIAS